MDKESQYVKEKQDEILSQAPIAVVRIKIGTQEDDKVDDNSNICVKEKGRQIPR